MSEREGTNRLSAVSVSFITFLVAVIAMLALVGLGFFDNADGIPITPEIGKTYMIVAIDKTNDSKEALEFSLFLLVREDRLSEPLHIKVQRSEMRGESLEPGKYMRRVVVQTGTSASTESTIYIVGQKEEVESFPEGWGY